MHPYSAVKPEMSICQTAIMHVDVRLIETDEGKVRGTVECTSSLRAATSPALLPSNGDIPNLEAWTDTIRP